MASCRSYRTCAAHSFQSVAFACKLQAQLQIGKVTRCGRQCKASFESTTRDLGKWVRAACVQLLGMVLSTSADDATSPGSGLAYVLPLPTMLAQLRAHPPKTGRLPGSCLPTLGIARQGDTGLLLGGGGLASSG